MKKIFVYNLEEKCQNYAEAIAFSGGEYVFSLDLKDAEGCDGLLLTGGGDIHPSRYGAENMGSDGIDEVRDENEFAAVKLFAESGRPILGICRGHQVLNVVFGGDMIQDLGGGNAVHRWSEETGDKVHPILVPQGSFLYDLYGGEFPVNSAHHQAACRVADCFTVAAMSQDGVVEAFEDRERNIYGVQFHPERMTGNKARPDTVDGKKIFDFFLGLC